MVDISKNSTVSNALEIIITHVIHSKKLHFIIQLAIVRDHDSVWLPNVSSTTTHCLKCVS